MAGWTDLRLYACRVADVIDGMSKTLMLSEVIQGSDTDLRGYTWWAFAGGFQTKADGIDLPPNSSAPDLLQPGAQAAGRERARTLPA